MSRTWLADKLATINHTKESMMVSFQNSITVNRPVDEVFRFMADPKNYVKWMNGVTQSEPLATTPTRVGARVRVAGKEGFWKYDNPMEITEYEPNRKLGISAAI